MSNDMVGLTVTGESEYGEVTGTVYDKVNDSINGTPRCDYYVVKNDKCEVYLVRCTTVTSIR